ncbi:MAG: hypothetical protein HKN59_08180 [Gammaproteobacteria bacterium]|nr:hypothetical protein [Gammaproteobacteria bacterium]
MTWALVFLALIMALVVGYLLSQTINRKPWLANDPLENLPSGMPQSISPSKLGLGVLLAVITSMFGLFFSAYVQRMELNDWSRVQEPSILWVNTVVLVLASVAMNQALRGARRDDVLATRRALIAAGLLSFVFLAGQLLAWDQLRDAGFYMRGNPAAAFFYLLTAIHGFHLIGGLWVWGRTSSRLRGAENVGEFRLSVELCTVYWHFMLLVWLFLFALLLNT